MRGVQLQVGEGDPPRFLYTLVPSVGLTREAGFLSHSSPVVSNNTTWVKSEALNRGFGPLSRWSPPLISNGLHGKLTARAGGVVRGQAVAVPFLGATRRWCGQRPQPLGGLLGLGAAAQVWLCSGTCSQPPLGWIPDYFS